MVIAYEHARLEGTEPAKASALPLGKVDIHCQCLCVCACVCTHVGLSREQNQFSSLLCLWPWQRPPLPTHIYVNTLGKKWRQLRSGATTLPSSIQPLNKVHRLPNKWNEFRSAGLSPHILAIPSIKTHLGEAQFSQSSCSSLLSPSPTPTIEPRRIPSSNPALAPGTPNPALPSTETVADRSHQRKMQPVPTTCPPFTPKPLIIHRLQRMLPHKDTYSRPG